MIGLLRACVRRWPVLVICLGLTGVAVLALGRPTVLYAAQTVVTVETPQLPTDRTLAGDSPQAIAAAHLLVDRANGGPTQVRSSSPDAELYGWGMDRVVRVQIRNIGGQWASNVNQPSLQVDVVDTTADAVRTKLRDTVADLRDELQRLQDELNVPAISRMTLRVPLDEPAVAEVSSSRMRASVAIGLLGLLASLSVVWLVDSRPLRSQRIA